MNKNIVCDVAIDNSIGPLIHKIDHSLYLKHNEILAEKDLTFQQSRVLFFILVNRCSGKEVNQKDVKDHMCLKGSTVTSLIKNMIEKGLISKTQSLNDGRYWNLDITEKGEELYNETYEVFDSLNKKMRKDISDYEIEKFKGTLRKILKNIED